MRLDELLFSSDALSVCSFKMMNDDDWQVQNATFVNFQASGRHKRITITHRTMVLYCQRQEPKRLYQITKMNAEAPFPLLLTLVLCKYLRGPTSVLVNSVIYQSKDLTVKINHFMGWSENRVDARFDDCKLIKQFACVSERFHLKLINYHWDFRDETTIRTFSGNHL